MLFHICVFQLKAQDTAFINKLNKEAFRVRQTDPLRAIDIARNALMSSIKIKYIDGEALAYSRIGLAKMELGQYDSSLQYFNKNLDIRKSENDLKGQSSTFQNLGILYKIKGDLDSAIYYYNKSLSIALQIDDNEKIIDNETNIAIVLRIQGYDSLALQYFEKAAQSALDFNDNKQYAGALLNIANTYDQLGQIILAREYYKKSLNQYQNLENRIGIAKATYGLGVSHYKTGEFDKALEYSLLSIAMFKTSNATSSILNNYNALGAIYIDMGLYSKGIKYLDSAERGYQTSGNLSALLDVYPKKAQAYAAVDSIYESNLYLNKYINLRDSLHEDEIDIKLQEQLIKFDTERKTFENHELHRENKIMKLQNRAYLISIILIIAMLLLPLIIYLQTLRLKKRKIELENSITKQLLNELEIKSINSMLEGQEEERKRIAEELHDRVGSILSTVKLYFGSLEGKIDSFQAENLSQYLKANALLDDAVEEVRRISHNLLSGILVKFGLTNALQDLCESIEGTGKIKVNLLIHGLTERMDNQREIAVYRIIQELISNALRHSHATELNINITKNNGNLNFLVEDNGIGFKTEIMTSGIGLKNVKARVEKLNGQLTIDSDLNKGTTIIIDIPFENKLEI